MTGTAQSQQSDRAEGIKSLFDDEHSQWILRFDSMLNYAQTATMSPQQEQLKTLPESAHQVHNGEKPSSVPSSPAQTRRNREKKYSLPGPNVTTPVRARGGIPVRSTDSLDRSWTASRGSRAVSAPPVKRFAVKPSSPSPANGPIAAGSVDEQVFHQAFEESTPRVEIHSPRDLDFHLSQAKAILGNADADWEKRIVSLKNLRGIVRSGGALYEEFFVALKLLEVPLESCARDLRSQVVREACITIAYMCRELGRRVDRFCEILLPTLIQLIGSTVRIMSTSGMTCIRFMLQHVHAPRLIPLITRNMSSKNREIRRYCCEFLHQLLTTWPANSLERHLATIQEAIKKGISDADREARTQARNAFWGFAGHFQKEAERLLYSLDEQKRQNILKDDKNNPMTQSFSTASLTRSTIGLNSARTPSTESLNRSICSPYGTTSRSAARRSNSLIDAGAARSSRLRLAINSPQSRNSSTNSTPTTPLPQPRNGFGFGQSLSRSSSRTQLDSMTMSSYQVTPTRGRQSRMTQSQPNSRSASPAPRLSYSTYNMLPDGRMRKSGIPTPTSGRSREPSPTRSIVAPSRERRSSISRAPSRNRYDSLDRTLRNGREGEERLRSAFITHQPYASPLASRAAFSASQQVAGHLQGGCNQDSEGSSSICSDISRHEDITDIIHGLANVQWTDRKEALLSLQTVLRSHTRRLTESELKSVTQSLGKMFMDPSLKVLTLFLDTIYELIATHPVELHRLGFLQMLLTKLFTKLGQDLLSSLNTKIQAALNLIRDSFPRQDQFLVLTKFLNDPAHQSGSMRVKLSVLRYFHSLTRLMDSSEVPSNDPNMRACMLRFIVWASDLPEFKGSEFMSAHLDGRAQTRPSELASLARACIGSLYRCKTSYFSVVINQMAPEYQRVALDIIQNEIMIQQQHQSKLEQPNKISFSNGSISSGVSRSGSESLPSPITPQKSASPLRSLDYIDAIDNLSNELSSMDTAEETRQSMRVSPKSNTLSADSLAHCVSVLSSPLNSCELKRAALRELKELLNFKQLWGTEYNFRSTLKILLDNTEPTEEAPIRAESLRVLSTLIEGHPEHFANYADLTFVKLLQTQMDKEREVQKASDLAITSVLKVAPVDQTSGILSRFVSGCQDCNMIAAAIKMLSKLVELSTTDDLDGSLGIVTPALLTAYNHDESTVRRAAVYCLVSLHQKVGAARMEPHTAALHGSKLRLLKLYIERAASQRNGTTSPGVNVGSPSGVSTA